VQSSTWDISTNIDGIEGRLVTKNPKNLGKYVRWYKDSAVFFQDSDPNTKGFNSVFLPTDDRQDISTKDGLEAWVEWKDI